MKSYVYIWCFYTKHTLFIFQSVHKAQVNMMTAMLKYALGATVIFQVSVKTSWNIFALKLDF